MDITIWWRAYGDASSGTEYNVYNDIAESGAFVLLTETAQAAIDRGDTGYGPYTTTLAENADEGGAVLVFVDGSNFSNGDRVKIEGETYILGGKDGNTFAACTPGADNTITRPHLAGTEVWAMHESYTDEDVEFPEGRHVIRYRVRAVVDDVELVAAEAVAVNPEPPRTNDFCRIWGILDGLDGVPLAGKAVSLTIGDMDNFNPRTMETYHSGAISTTTDADGYWQLHAPRGIARVGADTLTLNVDGRTHQLEEIPNRDVVCYLEII